MMPRLLVVLACFLCPATALAADESAPCSAPEFRAFDFWAGNWRVTDADGTHVGDNTITSEETGCVLVERWRSARGGTGQSLNFFDPARGKWRQLWISPGSRIEIEGGVVGDYMILGKWDHPPGRGGSSLRLGDMEIIKKAKLVDFELYNVTRDIGQKRDLVISEPDRFESMKKQLVSKYREVQKEGPVWPEKARK